MINNSRFILNKLANYGYEADGASKEKKAAAAISF
jgi:hypothetical protein